MIKEKRLHIKMTYEQYHWLRESSHSKHISMGQLVRNILDTARDVEKRKS